MSNNTLKTKENSTDHIPHEYAALRNLGQDMSLVLKAGVVRSVPWVPQRPKSCGFAEVKTRYCGICGADLRYAHGTKIVAGRPEGVVLGHSCVGYLDGKLVVPMVHLIPSELKNTQAFSLGNVYQLDRTYHAGMDVNGTFATRMVWPREYLVEIPQEVVAKAQANCLREIPGSMVYVEIEHLACVETGLDHFEKEEARLGAKNVEALKAGNAKIAVVGTGWMGLLMLAQLQRRYSGNRFLMVDPNSARTKKIAAICERAGFEVPLDITDLTADYAQACDLVVLVTAASQAVDTGFSLLKPEGHLMLFSGFNDTAVTDPTGLVNLERVHRLGTAISVAAVDHKPYFLSGSSGYSIESFQRAVHLVAELAGVISLGITGYICRDEAVLHSLDPEIPDFTSDQGAAFERVFDKDGDWPTYVAQHLKIVWLTDPLVE